MENEDRKSPPQGAPNPTQIRDKHKVVRLVKQHSDVFTIREDTDEHNAIAAADLQTHGSILGGGVYSTPLSFGTPRM
jgi:hypothetical protein